MATSQIHLFADTEPLPEGLVVKENFLSAAEEHQLLDACRQLPFAPFQFRGFEGNRRVASFGWQYDFNRSRLSEAAPIPDFLLALAPAIATLDPGGFDQISVLEYRPGAGIGWHRDRPLFGNVVGLSLLAPCRFRLRRAQGDVWERHAFSALPRSAYLLSGAARWEWEHSVPPVDALRYAITFRKLLDPSDPKIQRRQPTGATMPNQQPVPD
jgi:alkylated DNA repair dioxygenase AlkB